VVVNDLTRTDQEFIRNLTREREHRKCSDVFVVHNLKNVSSTEEFEVIWKSLCSLYAGSEEVQQISDEVFVRFYTSPKNHTRHICLLNDNVEFGKRHNDSMMELMKRWIDSILTGSAIPETERIELDPILNVFKKLLPNYIANVRDVVYENGVFKAVIHENKKPLVIGIDPTETNLFDTSLGSFEPLYRVEASETEYSVVLEVPSMEPSEIKCQLVKGAKQDTFAIKISGEKKRPVPTKNQISVPEDLQDVNKRMDICKYGTWALKFFIPNFYVMVSNPPQQLSSGVVKITFPINPQVPRWYENSND